MSDRSQYFGEKGPFAEAGDLYRDGHLPAEILAHAETLDRSRIAFSIGYAFAVVLHRRGMTITAEDLEYIAKGKITYGDWQEYVKGFQKFTP